MLEYSDDEKSLRDNPVTKFRAELEDQILEDYKVVQPRERAQRDTVNFCLAQYSSLIQTIMDLSQTNKEHLAMYEVLKKEYLEAIVSSLRDDWELCIKLIQRDARDNMDVSLEDSSVRNEDLARSLFNLARSLQG